MTVSFQGIKNVGAYSLKELDSITNKEKTMYACVNLELTDRMGRDLTNMENIIKRYRNPINKNFIKLDYINKDRIANYDEDLLILNGKELKISDENLSIFEKLMQLFGKVLDTPKEELIVNRDFLTSEDCKRTFERAYIFDAVEKQRLADKNYFMERLHVPKNVQKSLPDLMKIIQDSMIEYFS